MIIEIKEVNVRITNEAGLFTEDEAERIQRDVLGALIKLKEEGLEIEVSYPSTKTSTEIPMDRSKEDIEEGD